MAKFRKKPVIIEAFQLSYEMAIGKQRVPKWFSEEVNDGSIEVFVTAKIQGSQYCKIKTLEGIMTANAEDFIIQGVQGEIYPCKPDIFKATYELIEG